MKRKQYIFGNWKMNHTLSVTKDFLKKAEAQLADANLDNIVVGIGVPSINITKAQEHSNKIQIAAQNVYHKDAGAFTGEISAEMLSDVGTKYCIVGHSERRVIFNESSNVINQKIHKLLKVGITPIFCLGESEEDYNDEKTASVVQNQIGKGFANVSENDAQNIIVAYEPIWAIGTGKTATAQSAQETIKIIRDKLASLYNQEIADHISILYGGSVKPDNIKEFMAQDDIDGALVGGASLTSESFIALYKNK